MNCRKRGNCGIAGALGDGAVQRQVLVDRRLALRGGAVHRLQRGVDRAHLRARGALGGEPGGLHLHAQAQLHHVQDLLQRCCRRSGSMRNGALLRLGRDEGADALARHHQALGAQRRHGFAHHGAADARRARQLLLGGQALAGRQPAALDLRRRAGRTARRESLRAEARGRMRIMLD